MSLYGILPVSQQQAASAASAQPPPPQQQQQQQQQQQRHQQQRAGGAAEAKAAAGAADPPAAASTLPSGWAAASLSLQPSLIRRAPPKKPPRPHTSSFPGAEFKVVAKTTVGAAPAANKDDEPAERKPLPAQQLVADSVLGGNAKPPFTPARVFQKQQNDKRKPGKRNRKDVPSLEDDYDPGRPNDYEEYKEMRKRQKEEEARSTVSIDVGASKRKTYKQQANSSSSPPPYQSYSRSPSPPAVRGGLGSVGGVSRAGSSGYGEPAPLSNVNLDAATGEEAFLARARLSGARNAAAGPTVPAPQPPSPPNQPIQYALAPFGTEDVRASPFYPSRQRGLNVITMTGSSFMEGAGLDAKRPDFLPPLRQVSPGEVDDALQEETAEECTKFGQVEKCLIFEVGLRLTAMSTAKRGTPASPFSDSTIISTADLGNAALLSSGSAGISTVERGAAALLFSGSTIISTAELGKAASLFSGSAVITVERGTSASLFSGSAVISTVERGAAASLFSGSAIISTAELGNAASLSSVSAVITVERRTSASGASVSPAISTAEFGNTTPINSRQKKETGRTGGTSAN
ncbi:MAG: hypothetical protein BJ554DRAFT_770 [Olpidium bornovanus]|uniref:Uncharacterized protein n=1 Tax=Olpidium bornovanus TaxID=278681 RepID=A0A8H8DHM8_9FUNG|nr:MAG: hypothetical protein BJ554DRAFT_770 [Olpidium bornovanus]